MSDTRDYWARKISQNILSEWRANPGIAGDPDLGTRIERALHQAERRGFERGVEAAVNICDVNARDAFLHELRDDTNRPGSKDIPRNAYNMAEALKTLIRALLTVSEGGCGMSQCPEHPFNPDPRDMSFIAQEFRKLRAENKAALDNRNEATKVWIQSGTQCRAYANQLEKENAALKSQLHDLSLRSYDGLVQERDRYKAALENLMKAHRTVFARHLFVAYRAGKTAFHRAWMEAEKALGK